MTPMNWKFRCPSCGHVASVQDWKNAGAPENAAAFSCVGRWLQERKEAFTKNGPCNYAGGGLFRLNPVKLEGMDVGPFDFADDPLCQEN